VTGSHTPPGLVLADTVVQDVGFVLAAVFCAGIGGRMVRSWQFGLNRPGIGWSSAGGLVLALLSVFLLLNVIWSALVNPGEDKLLDALGSNEGTALLLLSAGLTCVMAPICEEFLFRGFMFTAIRNRTGTLPAAAIVGLVFGGVHYESAPVLDLVPLAALGFGLCLLYRYSGSLYPSIAAHSLNNSLAFGSLENWPVWQVLVLMAAALSLIWLVARIFERVGLISASPPWQVIPHGS
jgi:membrane protease YdiL (CAAX protease family)